MCKEHDLSTLHQVAPLGNVAFYHQMEPLLVAKIVLDSVRVFALLCHHMIFGLMLYGLEMCRNTPYSLYILVCMNRNCPNSETIDQR